MSSCPETRTEESVMKNMGNLDRLLRLALVVAVALAWLAGAIGGTLAMVLGVVALVLLATSLISFCPLYRILGISTRPRS
ncbi:MAG: hypothetical protein BGN82_01690 [Alphaproteobacteria bacterium 65-7]|nr:MAG: hypothetical protein BGN82_01690 [Alphaproteobacteria bacterium 65-7]